MSSLAQRLSSICIIYCFVKAHQREGVSFDLGVAILAFCSYLTCGITMGECRSIISNNRHFKEERSPLLNIIDKASQWESFMMVSLFITSTRGAV